MADANSNATRAFGGVVAIVALIAGLAAIVRPMQNQLDYIRGENKQLRIELKEHAAMDNHPWGVKAEIAKLRQQFAEVETQFKNLDERTFRNEATAKENLHLLDEKLQREIEVVQKEVDWLRGYHVQGKELR